MLMSQTASAAPWRVKRNQIVFDNELGIRGFCTLRFATETGSYIRPVTKLYGTKISLEEYVPTREGYTFVGWFTDPRTKQNQVTEFMFTRHDVVYAKWEKVRLETDIDGIIAEGAISNVNLRLLVREIIVLDMENNELALVIVMNAPFGEYGEIFDDDGNVTLAHNGDYKPIPLEEVKN